MKKTSTVLASALCTLTATTALSSQIEIEEFALFAHSSAWSHSAEDFQVGFEDSTFDTVGLGVTFANNLASDNTGTVSWRVTNNSGVALTDLNVFGFLNADIDFTKNTFYNEYAEYAGNTNATSYEIDEPGYFFGDIYGNLLAGSLDNNNGVPASAPDDVSMALGFNLGSLEIGDWFETTWTISESNIGGIKQTDPDSEFSFFFNGELSRSVVSVSEAGSLWLLMLGLPALALARRRLS